MKVMLLLMGEQPAANLLPVRRDRPECVVILHTNRTVKQAQRLAKLLDVQVVMLPVDPYQIASIVESIHNCIRDHHWENESIVFNLTGGTKPMSFAAYEVARSMAAPAIYFQTEGGQSHIYRYAFDADCNFRSVGEDDVVESITLADYMGLYLDNVFVGEPREPLEAAVADALRRAGLEVMNSVYPQGLGGVEIDLVIRDGNRIGVMEVKSKGAKAGIDQVVAVAGQRHIGTYVSRFLVSITELDKNNQKIANAHNVAVILLPGYSVKSSALSPEDGERLATAVLQKMRRT